MKALLQQAMEALELAQGELDPEVLDYTCPKVDAAIAALQAAIDAPEPEPVAWVGAGVIDALKAGKCVTSTMTKHKAFEDDVQIFTHPPAARQPLNDAEIDAITVAQWGEQIGAMLAAYRAYARAIEAALRAKP